VGRRPDSRLHRRLCAGGWQGVTLEARDKIVRDFKDPQGLFAIYQGIQHGLIEGALDDLLDNVTALAELAGWLAKNLPVAGGMSYEDIKDRIEWFTDPAGKAAREHTKLERRQALLEGFAQFAVQFAKDPSVMADLGVEFGQAAGDYVAHQYTMFANAPPFEKGRMVGHGLGYLAMEIALLFVGPETLIAKAPAAVAKLVRGGGAAVRAVVRLMEKIPALRKLLAATGRLAKVADTAAPEAKLLTQVGKAEAAVLDASKLGRTVESHSVELLGQSHTLRIVDRGNGELSLVLCSDCSFVLGEIEAVLAQTSAKGPTKSLRVRLERLRAKVVELETKMKSGAMKQTEGVSQLQQIAAHLGDVSKKFPSANQLCVFCSFKGQLDYELTAKNLGFERTGARSHGQPVYRRGNEFISPDVDRHNGGIWKKATGDAANLRNKTLREGTFNEDLTEMVGP
jgi:hypothetical protein